MPLGESEIEGEKSAELTSMDRPIKRGPLIRDPRLLAGTGAVLLVGAGFFVFSHGFGSSLSVGTEKLTVSQVRYGTFREYVPITGNVAPRETVYLDAVEGGQVQEINVEAGAMVTAGEPLVHLKNSDLQLQVISTEAQLAEQISNLNSTRLAIEQNRLRHKRELVDLAYKIEDLSRRLKRRRELLSSGAAPAAEVGDMQAELAYLGRAQAIERESQQTDETIQSEQVQQLNEAVQRITTNLALVRDNLENLEVKAPIAGQLTVFDVKIGQSIPRDQRIGQIDEVGSYKVQAPVDEFYLGRIAVGQAATADINGARIEFTVAKVYPDVHDRQFQVDLLFVGKPPASVRRGQTLRLNLEIGSESRSLVVANGPFIDDTGGKWAFVVAPGKRTAVKRAISIGRRNPDEVEVLGGLKSGERVITSSYDEIGKFDRIDLTKGSGT
ncbi:MAG TPA: HlyD family efflux transporter periplasmic adaptor subunit [Alphaproteobacteria bacterium]|nr:HlyD family efflux transporter periplasmic adaptor subunit [Alphaproteobacteria bacterium]